MTTTRRSWEAHPPPPKHGPVSDGLPSAWTAWGRLLRLPNLFTVPGDTGAGFLLVAGAWHPGLAFAGSAALFLYCGGLLLNDYYDREEDARDRPSRPIPSGQVRPGTVRFSGYAALLGGTMVSGLGGGIPGLLAGGALSLVIVSYDAGGKRSLLGPFLMGLCRGGSVLLGAVLAGFPGSAPAGRQGVAAALLAASGSLGYTLAITLAARDEVSGRCPAWKAFSPAACLLALGGGMLFLGTAGCPPAASLPALLPALAFPVLAAIEACHAACQVRAGRLPVPAFIGRTIRIMILVQAGWAAWALAGTGAIPVVIALFLALRLATDRAARKFYGS